MRSRNEVTGNRRRTVRSGRRPRHRLVVLAFGLTGLVAGCAPVGSEPEPTGTATSVSPEAFEPLLDAAEVTVVNVHVPYEGELPSTDLFVPYDQIADAAELPDDRGAVLAVYCLTGRMSRQAAGTLADLGYERVVELDGGMVAWRESGRPLLDLDPTGPGG